MLKFLFGLLLFFLPFFALATESRLGYLKAEDDEVVSVFNMPGVNWKTCANTVGCKPVGWIPKEAKIKIKGEQYLTVINPYTLEPEASRFLEIDFQYNPQGFNYVKQDTGWVDAAFIATQPYKSFYSPTRIEKNEDPCPPDKKGRSALPRIIGQKRDLEAISENSSILAINKAAERLRESVGKCAINPPGNLKSETVKSWGQQISYDAAVLPLLRKTELPKVIGENGQNMNRQQMIDIDALARTLYGEMASCFKHGLEYPMAVAKIAYNRFEFVDKSPDRAALFDRGGHSSDKGPIAKIVTAKDQFSVWNKYDSKRGKENPLKLSLCPPQTTSKAFWTGSRPPAYEVNIWNNAVRIATETVLFPKQFKKRTKEIDHYYYTSGMSNFLGMKREFASIEGRKVSKNACIELWNGKP